MIQKQALPFSLSCEELSTKIMALGSFKLQVFLQKLQEWYEHSEKQTLPFECNY